MKKIVLTLASVLAATAFAPEAAAVPTFARQTGMACNSCHFQTYPALTAFGRSFKAAGYTMIGAEGKIEGEHGLSIPDTLNSSIYIQWRYIKTNGPSPSDGTGTKTNYGRLDMPDEFSLFMGGRVSEGIGFLTEVALGATAGVAGIKMPFMSDAGNMKVGIIPYTTGGLGAGYGFDLFATGSNGGGRITENGMGYGAALYMGSTNNGGATGIALVAVNDDFHVNFSPYAAAGATAQASMNVLKGQYLRAAWTPNIGGFDVGVGLQRWSGDSTAGGKFGDTSLQSPVDDKLTIIDAQAQGEWNGMPTGLYASYGTAGATTGVKPNSFNGGTQSKTALGLMADVWVMPGTLGLQVGLLRGKTGQLNANDGKNETDNSISIGARYKIRQNVKVGFAMTKFSGTAYSTGGGGGANDANYSQTMGTGVAGVAPSGRGTSRMTLIVSAGL